MPTVKSSPSIRTLSSGPFAPKYVALAQKLLRDISSKRLRPGDRLGTETELVVEHGVSRFTVRHALSVLEREGYVSREKARGTFVKKSPEDAAALHTLRGTVLVVCSNEQVSHAGEDLAFATVLRSMERTLSDLGFLVQILSLGEDEEKDRARLQILLKREDLAGICTIGPCLEPYVRLLPDIPVVSSGYFHPGTFPMVGDDVGRVCRVAIEHLLSFGHRDIAVVCGHWVEPRAFRLFIEGTRAACEAVGVPFRRNMLYHVCPGESLKEVARDVLLAVPRPTAVFAENWRVCEAVVAAARELSIAIPADLSIVAYGQNVLQIAAPVQVTTYVPDNEGVGRRAAELLSGIVDGEPVPAGCVIMPGRLVERDSVRRLEPPQSTHP
ncbi:MAG: substrate-binding domain-containing protein [Phycisphaerae bacterium]